MRFIEKYIRKSIYEFDNDVCLMKSIFCEKPNCIIKNKTVLVNKNRLKSSCLPV